MVQAVEVVSGLGNDWDKMFFCGLGKDIHKIYLLMFWKVYDKDKMFCWCIGKVYNIDKCFVDV